MSEACVSLGSGGTPSLLCSSESSLEDLSRSETIANFSLGNDLRANHIADGPPLQDHNVVEDLNERKFSSWSTITNELHSSQSLINLLLHTSKARSQDSLSTCPSIEDPRLPDLPLGNQIQATISCISSDGTVWVHTRSPGQGQLLPLKLYGVKKSFSSLSEEDQRKLRSRLPYQHICRVTLVSPALEAPFPAIVHFTRQQENDGNLALEGICLG